MIQVKNQQEVQIREFRNLFLLRALVVSSGEFS